jgi:uncharacterized membrane protein
MPTERIQTHFRQTFLAGIFAAIPIGVTVAIMVIVYVKAAVITEAIVGRHIPGVGLIGIVVAIVFIYFAGVVATTLVGRWILRIVDSILGKMPGLRVIYTAWKQIALTPSGTEGIYSNVVLIPDETGATHLIGFTNGKPLEGDPFTYCVFVPASPNPINGRLYFVHRDKCEFVDVTADEAFKAILSTGNYVPPAIGIATHKLMLRHRGVTVEVPSETGEQ